MEHLKPTGSDKVLRAFRGDKRAGPAPRPQLGLPVPTDRYMLDGRHDVPGSWGGR